jgi:serine/threonine protein kinase
MTARPDAHPSDAELEAFAQGRVSDRAVREILDHLDVCANCRQRAASLPEGSFADPGRASLVANAGKSSQAGSGPTSRPTPSGSTLQGPVAALPPDAPTELAALTSHEIMRELGRGGMGVVYLARNKLLDRLEVLKTINKATVGRQSAVDRFLQEMRSAARLSHANVATAYAAHQLGDSLVFAMEYVDGDDLAKVRQRGPLQIEQACWYVSQAAEGLQHGHEQGLVHRDIKPGNLLLTKVGERVKIVDFGLAKARAESPGDRELTNTNQMMGTPGYTAPEQLSDAKSADIRADVYSLGSTLFSLLTGQPAFGGASAFEVMIEQNRGAVRSLREQRPDLPQALADVVNRMMARNPDHRYAEPIEVVRALAAFHNAGPGGYRVNAGSGPASILNAETIAPGKTGDTVSKPAIEPVSFGSSASLALPNSVSTGSVDSLVICCPHCNTRMRARTTIVGKSVKCKKCDNVFLVGSDSPTSGQGSTPAPNRLTRGPGATPTGTATIPPASKPPRRAADFPTELPGNAAPPPVRHPQRDPTPSQPIVTFSPVPTPTRPTHGSGAKVFWIALGLMVLVAAVALGTAFWVDPTLFGGSKPEKTSAKDDKAKTVAVTPPTTTDPAPKAKEVANVQDPKPPIQRADPATTAPIGLSDVEKHDLAGTNPAKCEAALAIVEKLDEKMARPLVPELVRAVKQQNDSRLRDRIMLELNRVAYPLRRDIGSLNEAMEINFAPVQLFAISALQKMDRSIAVASVPLLIEALDNDDRTVRDKSANLLETLGPDAHGAFEKLLKAASHSDPAFAQNALRALRTIGPPANDVEQELLGRTLSKNSLDRSVRVFAAQSLGSRGRLAEKTGSYFRAVLGDKDNHEDVVLMRVCIQGLRQIGIKDKAAARQFRELFILTKLADGIRVDALIALDQMESYRPPTSEMMQIAMAANTDPSDVFRDAAWRVLDSRLRHLRSDEMTELKPLLDAKDPKFIVKGLDVVINTRQAGGIESTLVTLLTNEEDIVRDKSLEALQGLGGSAKPALKELLAILKKAPASDLYKISLTIAAIEHKDPDVALEVVPRLLACWRLHKNSDPPEEVRNKIAKTVEAYGQGGVDGIFKYFEAFKEADYKSNVGATFRGAIYQILGEVGSKYPTPRNYKKLEELSRAERLYHSNSDTVVWQPLSEAKRKMSPR